MKKLVIDARMVGSVGHGIGKYVEGIAANLKAGDQLTEELLTLLGLHSIHEMEVVFLVRPDCPASSPIKNHLTLEVDLSNYDPRSWLTIPNLLKKHKADLYFNPTFASFPSLPCDYVQTVHDLNHLHFGSITQKLYYELLLKKSMKAAKRVFTVSNAIRDELMKWSEIAPAKISVIYNQFEEFKRRDADSAEIILKRYGLKNKGYFFCVTNPKPHKNLAFLVEAYLVYRGIKKTTDEKAKIWSVQFAENQNFVKSDTKLPLVVTVSSEELASQADGSSVVLAIGNIDDETLAVLYQECAGFYFPSSYEGFGRPPVEAAKAGVPYIVVSDIPVHHEAQILAKTQFHFGGVQKRR